MKTRRILTAVLILLICAACGYFAYESIKMQKIDLASAVRVLLIAIAALTSIIKMNYGQSPRRTLRHYESFYKNEIGRAFSEDPKGKKKLLSAIRLYNEDKFKKAASALKKLKDECVYRQDTAAVLLFLALCYSDCGLKRDAIATYEELLRLDPTNATVHNNLGLLYESLGDGENALSAFEEAIYLDPSYAQAYNNLANFYFKEYELEGAMEYAHLALEKNSRMYQASGLLAIIYAIMGDTKNKEKYFHMAVASGQDKNKLRNAIEYYLENFDMD
ncbi:MAG: tetratricopeptide repeat protein [Clostridia bacterium]|nr:tetratricopeptide repeat protein [Clostridia bacterium]